MIWFGKSFIKFCKNFINLIKLVSTQTCSLARVREKTYENTIGATMEELYLPTVPVPVHHMEGFYNSASKLPKCRFEAMYRQNRQADDSRENGFSWIGAAVLQCEKVQGWIPLHEMYIFDTQEKSDRRNTNGILLSHGKLKGFQVNGRAGTF